MKAAILCGFFLLALAFAIDVHVQEQTEEDPFRKLFGDYIREFNKKYHSESEYRLRFQNFKENVARNTRLNAQSNAKYGLNQFSDMSLAEFSSQRLNKVKLSGAALATSCLSNGVTLPLDDMNTTALPTGFDWRQKGVVTRVKDQGQCGSCWAFSTIGNIESQWAIHGHPLTEFSEQLLVDCSIGCSLEPPYGNVCNQGCGGGWQWNAFSDIVSWRGVETEVQYPYTAVDGTCQRNSRYATARISNYTCLTNQKTNNIDEHLMAAFLIKNGPLSIAMDASLLFSYSSGIIDNTEGECSTVQLDHALLIVGYGTSAGIPYWIVKNSWASTWGENGYFRIVRGEGACGLNTAVSTATM